MKLHAVLLVAAAALFMSGLAPSYAQAVDGGSKYVRIGQPGSAQPHETQHPAASPEIPENAAAGRSFDSSHNYVVITPKSDCLDEMRRDNPDKIIPDYAVSYVDCMKYKQEKEKKKKEVTAVEEQAGPETETPEKEKTLFHLLKKKFKALGDAKPVSTEDGVASLNR